MRATLSTALSGTLVESEYRELATRLERIDGASPAFDARAWDPSSIARVRAIWHDRMVNEYTSVTVFTQLAAQLVEANASLDHTAVTLRMAQDELRHAEICGEVVRAMGGRPARERETSVVAIARHDGCSDAERALRNVVFTTCLSEMNSVSYFVAILEQTRDAYLRAATRRLLADEVLHGRFGFAYLEAWAPWLEAHPEARDSIARYLRYAFAFVERELAGGERHTTTTRDDGALGMMSEVASRALFDATMRDAVVPGLERFGIAAEDAWRRRTLAP